MTAATTARTNGKRSSSRSHAAGLIAAVADGPAPPAAASTLPLDAIDPGHWPNPRGDVDTTTDAFKEFVGSLEAQDILEPLVVGPPILDGGKHPLIAGWRRYNAATILKRKSVPVHVRADITTAKDALLAGLAENMGRENMPPVAEAKALEQLGKYGIKQADAAKALGISIRTARNRITLLKVPDQAREAFADGTISLGAAGNLAALAKKHERLAAEVVAYAIAQQADKGWLEHESAILEAVEDIYSLSLEESLEKRAVFLVPASSGTEHWRQQTVRGEDLPMTAEQLERWRAIPPIEYWQKDPPGLVFGPDDVEAADKAGCLLRLGTRPRGGGREVLFITGRDFIVERIPAKLQQAEEVGRAAAARREKEKAREAVQRGQSGAKGLTAKQQEAARKERGQQKRDREDAHVANLELGRRVGEATGGLKLTLDVAKLLALLAVEEHTSALVARGLGYCDDRYITYTELKNGDERRAYSTSGSVHGDDNGVDDLYKRILEAKKPEQAIAAALEALVLARFADQAVVAASSKSYYQLPGTYGHGGSRLIPELVEKLARDLDVLPPRVRKQLGDDVEPDPAAAEADPGRLPRGTCTVCGAEVALRKGDLVREHRGASDAPTCAGSGKPAASSSTAVDDVVVAPTIVHVRPTGPGGGDPVKAELQPDRQPGRPDQRKVIYTASRTAAWILASRIVEDLEQLEGETAA